MLHRILSELGLVSLWHSPTDTKLLCAQRFVRLFAYGGSTLILASYLSALNISDDKIGLFMALTLIGDVVISFFLTLFADTMGRKAVLMLGSALMCGSGLVFALSGNFWVLLAAAIVGVISPNGNEIGPFRAVEESTIAHITVKESMSDIYAWYSLIGTAGAATGMMVCGWVLSILQGNYQWDFVPACRVIFMIYGAAGAIKLILTTGLTVNVEADAKKKKQQRQQQQPQNADNGNGTSSSETDPLLGSNSQDVDAVATTPNQRKLFFLPGVETQYVGLIISLIVLLGVDAFASSLASLSWITYYFRRKFGMSDGELGSLFSGTSVIQAISMLLASSIAKRFGNVKTMVFTHVPSGVFLAVMSLPNSLPLAMTFLIGRACLQNMDVAPRSAFLANALPAEQRTAIMGTINVFKTFASSVAPVITGMLSAKGALWVSFVIAGCLKISYDFGMLITFGGMDKEHQRQKKPVAEDVVVAERDESEDQEA